MSFWQQIFEEYLFDNRIFTYLEKVHENINKIYKHYYLHFSLQMFLMCFFFNEKIVFNHHL